MQLSGRSWDLLEIQLAVYFYLKCIHINFFYIMKILTDFRERVGTGMDLRLLLSVNFTKELERFYLCDNNDLRVHGSDFWKTLR